VNGPEPPRRRLADSGSSGNDILGDMRPVNLSSRLYAIIDTLGDSERSPTALAQAVLDGGGRLLQLRMKNATTAQLVATARQVKALTDQYGAQLIINDRADVARLVDAAGVHLGQEDLPVSAARQLLGPGKLIGLSTHSLAQAQAAQQEDVADYLGFGPIFATQSKAQVDAPQGIERLREVCTRVRCPIVAIGGITAVTAARVLAAGASAVAIIGDIVRAADVRAKVRTLVALSAGDTAHP
jgi:thiamine-phosphate pyrophosphorylase